MSVGDRRHVFAIVLAGGEGKRLAPLTLDRAKPAVPFGGNYRLVDFALSNLVNAGYRRIVVLTQYKSHSLDRHLSTTWRLSPLLGNYVAPVPAQMRRGPHWFQGSADAIYQNLNLLRDERPDIVVVFGADHIYRMDPAQMVRQHIESGAGVTVAALRVAARAGRSVRRRSRPAPTGARSPRFTRSPNDAVGLPDAPHQVYASMGNYVFDCDDPGRRGTGRRRGARVRARHGRQHHPALVESGAAAGLRLHHQRGAGSDRARPRLLARRRHARCVLRRPHGPDLGAPGVQPLQHGVADPDPPGPAAAGQVRVRRRRPHRPRAGLDGLPGGDHLRLGGQPVGDLAQRARRFVRPVEGSVLFSGVRVGQRAIVRNAIVDKDVVSSRGHASASTPTPTASASPSRPGGSSSSPRANGCRRELTATDRPAAAAYAPGDRRRGAAAVPRARASTR